MRVTLALSLAGLLLSPGGAAVSRSVGAPADIPIRWTLLGGWGVEDPADSLQREARRALEVANYRAAADLFHQLRQRYPDSRWAPDSYYWEAFALYRIGGSQELHQARELLGEQKTRYPRSATRGDAATLLTRVQGQLAQRGDAEAAARVAVEAESAASARSVNPQGAQCSEDDDDTRVAALNALLQMDADRALPILKRVLARRDTCSAVLRRKAIFLVSQKRSSETEDILLGAARQDPDQEVREQAVFWLSQVGSERSVSALDSILRSSRDPELQKKAVFALAQTRNDRAKQILRTTAEQEQAPTEVREQAIFWLGQSHDADNAAWLRGLFARTGNTELKEKILFALSQTRETVDQKWLLDLAVNAREDVELRKKALFWAGQSGAGTQELLGLYDRMTDPELKQQLIFVYSQRREPQVVDKLIAIAKTEKDKELRKKAIFWLSQSRDPRAASYLEQVIEQP
jgi:HEAT repeat protein